MDDTLMQRPDRTAMLAALERLVQAESPSPDKARCDACANEVTELFRRCGPLRGIERHRLLDRHAHRVGWKGLDLHGADVQGDDAAAGALLVATTGRAREGDREQARQAGFDRFLAKPYDPDEVRQLLREREAALAGTPGAG